MKFLCSIICCVILYPAFNQQSQAGNFELGTRNTISLFENDGYTGMGIGGQFRIWLGNKLNTEWYADYITTDIGGLGNRKTGHIGWSVMFYPFDGSRKISPYLLAGHCFDLAKITIYNQENISKNRVSSAIQVGLGNSFRLTKNIDLSVSAQYMMHVGDDIHTYKTTVAGENTLTFSNPEDGHSHSHGNNYASEGHILITTSLNVKIADLW